MASERDDHQQLSTYHPKQKFLFDRTLQGKSSLVRPLGEPSAFDLLSRAHQLALFLHRDEELASRVAADALMRIAGSAARQDKRLSYQPKIRRYRLVLDREPLLQCLVCQESARWERCRNASAATADNRLCWFLAHLIRTTLPRSAFWVAVAMGRLVYDYSTDETLAIYDLVAQDDACSYQEDAVRAAKSRILKSLGEHFAPRAGFCVGPRGERRLLSRQPEPQETELVRAALCELTPWDTGCQIPEHIDPRRDELTTLCRGDDPGSAQRIELRRIHALLHPPCFERLVGALALEPPPQRLRIPTLVGDPKVTGGDVTAEEPA